MTARPMRGLDMFSGTGSIATAFRHAEHECDSLDMDPRFTPHVLYERSGVGLHGAPARPLRCYLGFMSLRAV